MNGSAGPEAEVSTPARSLGRATRVVVVLVLSALAGALVYFFFGRPPAIREYRAVDRLPHMSPDYTDTVIPANIAPLNFSLREPGRRYLVRISGEEETPSSSSADVRESSSRPGVGRSFWMPAVAGASPSTSTSRKTTARGTASSPSSTPSLPKTSTSTSSIARCPSIT